MMRVVAAAGLLVLLGATAGVAERNLIPTLETVQMFAQNSHPSRSGCRTSMCASPTSAS